MNVVGADPKPSRFSERENLLRRARAETPQYLLQLSYALFLFTFSFSGWPFLETADLHRLLIVVFAPCVSGSSPLPFLREVKYDREKFLHYSQIPAEEDVYQEQKNQEKNSAYLMYYNMDGFLLV